MMRKIPAVFICIFSFLGAARAADKTSERVLYVADKTGLSLYDIDHGHKFMRQIAVPDSGDYKGIAASVQLGRLYVTSYKHDELISIDLLTDKVVWRKTLGEYADSMAMMPDGKRMYLPFRDEIDWKIVDAATGNCTAAAGRVWPTGAPRPRSVTGPAIDAINTDANRMAVRRRCCWITY